MADVRTNIFGIGEVYELQREGQWVERNRESYREYGYFSIGAAINRIDHSNDATTASLRSPLPNDGSYGSSTSNSNFGYYVRGGISRLNFANETSVNISGTINHTLNSSSGNNNFGYFVDSNEKFNRLDYSNNNISIRSSLSGGGSYRTGTGNANFGYHTRRSSIQMQRIDYSNDFANPLLRGNRNFNSSNTGATSNNNFGYFAGGFASFSNVERINYSNDLATLSIRGPLSAGRSYISSEGNSNFGYFGGGGPVTSIIDRIEYSNDLTISLVRGRLTSVSARNMATSSASFGGSPVSYLGAPWTSTAPFGYFSGAALGALDRVDYTNDTAATTLRSALSVDRSSLAATGNQNFGYFGGGSIPGPTSISTIDRINYSNDLAIASVRGPLSLEKSNLAATGNSNFGWFNGGAGSVVDRINYVNDTTTSSIRGSLSENRSSHASTGNFNFGYASGGRTPTSPSPSVGVSSVDRIDYSNDSISSLRRGDLSYNNYFISATGNSNFGYFGAGFSPISSTVNRIDYSNDTLIASIRGPLNSAIGRRIATGNSNFGYFGGGQPGTISIVDRIDYSNDTATASVRGPLSSARFSSAASSSQAFGGAPNTSIDPLPSYIRAATKWIDSNTLDLPFKRALGSFVYFGGAGSFLERIDYSNDLVNASIRSQTINNRAGAAGVENSNFGYFAGGYAPGGITPRVDRITYSNDTDAPLIRGSLSAARRYMGGTSTNSYGYIGGGGSLTRVDRIDFTNDLPTASIRGPLTAVIYRSSATGNSNFGYFGGGEPGPKSIINRVSYSNDTAIASVRGPLSSVSYRLAATGNSNFGYFGGGRTQTAPAGVSPFNRSTIDRINYSNDTLITSTRGPLNYSRYWLSATGNSNFGYFIAGYPVTNLVEKIDYSNDTALASIRGPLNTSRFSSTALTNARSS